MNRVRTSEELRQATGMPAEIRGAHDHCIRNAAEIRNSDLCGCFHCLSTFRSGEIEDWAEDGPRYNEIANASEENNTAICPRCGVDSVIGSAAGYALTGEFLGRMKSYWF